MLITEILARNARMYGEETALIERSPAENSRREITWTRFNDQSNRLARALADMVYKRGTRSFITTARPTRITFSLYSAPLSYRRQNALVRQFHRGRESRYHERG